LWEINEGQVNTKGNIQKILIKGNIREIQTKRDIRVTATTFNEGITPISINMANHGGQMRGHQINNNHTTILINIRHDKTVLKVWIKH